MSKLNLEEVLKGSIQELMRDPGNIPPFTIRIINKYLQRVTLSLESKGKAKDVKNEFLRQKEIITAWIEEAQTSNEYYYSNYVRLKALKKELKSWEGLFNETFEGEGEDYLSEIFIRLLEEKEGVEIISARQLQELSGITERYGYWDEDKQKIVSPGDKKLSKKEAQDLAYKQMENAFINAMNYRYHTTLREMLEAGAKYKDLLEIKPQDFNLPESWEGTLAKDQYTTILWAIESAYWIGDKSIVRADLRSIAEDIEAPYSVLMDAHKISNIWSD